MTNIPEPGIQEFMMQAAHILADEQQAIIFRWVQRISTLEVYRNQQRTANLEELISRVPHLLDALRDGMLSNESVLVPDAACEQAIQDYAGLRFAQGIPITDLMSEYQWLRYEIWNSFKTRLETPNGAQILQLEQAVNFTLDTLIRSTLLAYEMLRASRYTTTD